MKKIIYSLFVLAMAAFTFSSCEDVPAPYDMPTKPETPELQPTGSGTAADPFNIAAVEKYIDEGGSAETEIYVKGKVVSVKQGSFDPQYGSLKYYISEDGTATNQFYVYNGYAGPNRTKFSGEDALKPGDEVVICGKVDNYQGTKEFLVGNYIVSLNGQGGTTTPDTPTDGYINETFNKSFGTFTLKNIKGTPWVIDSYGYAKATGYENTSKVTTPSESYLVSKAIDLSSSKGAALKFSYILRYATYNGEPTEGVKNQVLITENYTGDPATTKWTNITGTLTEGTDWKTWSTYTYDLTPYKGKKNIVIALHYACEAKSGTWQIKELTVKEGTPTVKPETPDTPSTTEGISVNGLTVTLTNSGATTGESLKVEDLSTLKLDANPTEFTLSDGTIFKLDSNGNKTMPAYNEKAKELRIYANNIMTITGSKNIAKIILTCTHDNNKNTDCVGNETATIKFSGKTATYTNVFTGTTGGGVQLRIKSIEIVYAK
uniref:choice-of-anchor J domain-containing protein n=1 Tax=Segatella hominis TaxID=2518605 RepID=UPI00403857E6